MDRKFNDKKQIIKVGRALQVPQTAINQFKVTSRLIKEANLVIPKLRNEYLNAIKMQPKLMKSLNYNLDFSIYSSNISRLKNSITNFIDPNILYIGKRLRNIKPVTSKVIDHLSYSGWFFDLEYPIVDIWKLDKLINEKNYIEAEGIIAEYYSSRVNEIRDYLAEKFPQRSNIISSAVNAHIRGEYALSIPVVLAQTDGICKEVADKYLFIRDSKTKNPQVESLILLAKKGTFKYVFLSALEKKLPITYSEKQRGEDFNDLNRHQVLHGESVDYDTEINSLKAISCINYFAQVLSWIKDNNEE